MINKNKVDYSIYLVTDRALMSTSTIEESIEQAILGGASLIQLREKDVSSLDFYATALKVKKITTLYSVPLIINDRVDIALAIDADGVHIGQSDLPAKIVRDIIGGDKILGLSATNLDEAKKAVEDGADYLGVGAMFATNTKTDADIVSLETLSEIVNNIDVPIVVIGGINSKTIDCFKGIDIGGLAVVSAIISQKDITKATQELKKQFERNQNKTKDCKAVIFDLDGTILESMDVWENIDIKFLKKRGLEVPKNYINEICARSFIEAAEYTIALFDLDEKVEDIIKEWNEMALYEYSHQVALKPYVKEYIISLKQKGIKLAVATGLPKVLFEPALKNNDIYQYFDFFSSTDDVSRGKDFPDIWQFTADNLGVKPIDCLVYEDILPAIKSAKNLGMAVYGVYDKYSINYISQIKEVADGYIFNFYNQ